MRPLGGGKFGVAMRMGWINEPMIVTNIPAFFIYLYNKENQFRYICYSSNFYICLVNIICALPHDFGTVQQLYKAFDSL